MTKLAFLIVGAAVVLAAGPSSAFAEGDVTRGERWADLYCASCHTFEPDGNHLTGPNLWGVVGSVPGSADGYDRYKVAPLYVESGIEVWTEELLVEYFVDPAAFRDKYAGGASSLMVMGRLRPAVSQDIVTYLGTLSD